MRLCSTGRVPKQQHKLDPDAKVYTPEQVAEAKRRVTERRRAIEDERIDREIEERLK